MSEPVQPEWPKSGLMLNGEEHLEAEELIWELQDRWEALVKRGDEHVERAKRRGFASNYSPDTYSIQFGTSVVVLKKGQGRVSVSHNGKDVLRIFAMNIDLVNIPKLSDAMVGIRQYMILDDLANI